MAITTQQINELKGILDDLDLTYTDQDITVVAYSVARFVLASELSHFNNDLNDKE